MVKKIKQGGAATLVYMTLFVVVMLLFLSLGYSRYLLSLKRNLASSDSVISGYSAETQIYDVIARLFLKYLSSSDFDFHFVRTTNGTKIEVFGKESGNTQTIDVTAKRSFASNKLRAVRVAESSQVLSDAQIILLLDCTGSMGDPADPQNPHGPTRFDAQEEAAVSFLESLKEHPSSAKFQVGVGVFAIDNDWLRTPSGEEIKPASEIDINEIITSVREGFNSYVVTSPACAKTMDATSVGSGFVLAQDYFADNQELKTKQIEVLITDGYPNSRMPYDACPPSILCPGFNADQHCVSNSHGWSCVNKPADKGWEEYCTPHAMEFAECALAPDYEGGIRDPNIDVYSVTVYKNPPQDVVNLFERYSNAYYNAENANNLKEVLELVFEDISESFSSVSIIRVIPGVEE